MRNTQNKQTQISKLLSNPNQYFAKMIALAAAAWSEDIGKDKLTKNSRVSTEL